MSFRTWWTGARPRTLPAAIVPVVVGSAVAASEGDLVLWRVVAALVVALAIQVGTNYANDYSDGVRGTDDVRVGPVRLVASGLASPKAVKTAALLSFGVAAIAGLALALVVDPRLILVGVASFAAGWLYTGGPKPYGYIGLGEVMVFLFFGVVATTGSAYVHTEHISGLALAASVPVGLLATALLVANNLRDIPTDAVAGKRTLAVRVGDRTTRAFFVACVVVPFLLLGLLALSRPWVLLALLAVPLAVMPARRVMAGAAGPHLIAVLQDTGRVQLFYGLLLAMGLSR